MSADPDAREWAVVAEDGVWRITSGAGYPYTLGERVTLVPLRRALGAEHENVRYREALERIAYAQEFPGDELAALEGCRNSAREALKDLEGGPINHRESAWEDLHMQDISAGPVQPREAFDYGYDSAAHRAEDLLKTLRAVGNGAGIAGDPKTYPEYIMQMCRRAVEDYEQGA